MLSLTFRTLLLASVLVGISTALAPDIIELCPFTNFCAQTANRSLSDPSLQPCCLPCSCSPDCATVGKCCPDVGEVLDPEQVYPCRSQKSIYRSYLNKSDWRSDESFEYRIISRCLEKVSDNPELSESVSRCHNATGVEDLMFATGNISGHTYLNKHCAVCNNEPVFTEWDLYVITVKLITPGLTFEERDRRIMSDGGIISVPPTNEIALRAYCRDYAITRTCNFTGLWKEYDAELERKCHDTSMHFEYVRNIWPFRGTFSNVFCFLCNLPSETVVPTSCPAFNFDPNMDRSGGFPSLSAMLVPSGQAKTLTSKCAKADFWDPTRMVCTPLLCPVGSFVQYGSCLRTVGNVINDPVTVIMHIVMTANSVEETDVSDNVKPDNVDPTSSSQDATSASNTRLTIDYDLMVDDLTKLIRKQINGGGGVCGICDVELYQSKTGVGMYARTRLLSTQTCSENQINKGLFSLFRKSNANVKLQRTKLSISLVNLESMIDIDEVKAVAQSRVQRLCLTGSVFSTKHVILCPSIDLRVEDVHDLKSPYKSRIMDVSDDVGNGTVRICVDNYLSIVQASRASWSRQQQGPTLLILVYGLTFLVKVQP